LEKTRRIKNKRWEENVRRYWRTLSTVLITENDSPIEWKKLEILLSEEDKNSMEKIFKDSSGTDAGKGQKGL
jgi:hypothetical protein